MLEIKRAECDQEKNISLTHDSLRRVSESLYFLFFDKKKKELKKRKTMTECVVWGQETL